MKISFEIAKLSHTKTLPAIICFSFFDQVAIQNRNVGTIVAAIVKRREILELSNKTAKIALHPNHFPCKIPVFSKTTFRNQNL